MVDLGRVYCIDEFFRECAETRPANDAARIDAKAALRDDMMRTIGHAPRELIGDGKFHRFSTKSNGRGDAGYYRFHDDEYPYAIYGDWRSGQRITWSARQPATMILADRERFDRIKAEREREAAARRQTGSERAKARWDRAKPASPDHPYIVRKGIQPHGVRQEGGALLVPMFSDDGFSVQAIRAGREEAVPIWRASERRVRDRRLGRCDRDLRRLRDRRYGRRASRWLSATTWSDRCRSSWSA